MNYQEALQYLTELNRFGSQLGLARIEALVAELGHPENSYATIHVTGTNGKGSVSALLAGALKACGSKTGLYTSPHLCGYEERFQINGKNIEQAELAEVLTKVREAVEQLVSRGLEHPTEFEILTAAAFLYFQQNQVDVAVIEVGLGGLLDSTNVITPVLSVITNVSLEHQDRCGPRIQDIAKHKAGIIKAGVPVVTAAQGEALDVILAEASMKQAKALVYGQEFQVRALGSAGRRQKLRFVSGDWAEEYEMALLGKHQLQNAALVLAALKELGKMENSWSLQAVQQAFRTVKWPARFEVFSDTPPWIVDGAHNPAGMKALRQTLDEYFPGPVLFVLGILKDKNQAEMLQALLRTGDRVITVPVDSERSSTPAELAQKIFCCQAEAAASLTAGLDLAKRQAGYVAKCIAGSLYMVGHARILLEAQVNVGYNESN